MKDKTFPAEYVIKDGRRISLLTEQSFLDLVINGPQISHKTCNDFNVSKKCYNNSLAFYREKYVNELQQIRHERHAKALKGNTRGTKKQPDVILNREELMEAFSEIKSVLGVANHFNTTEYFIQKNLEIYNEEPIQYRYTLRPNNKDLQLVEKLSFFVPTIKENYLNYRQNPIAYFMDLYKTFLIVEDLIDFVKQEGKAFRHYRSTGCAEKSEICWSSNIGERKLSLALIEQGISHQRQVKLGTKKDKNWLYDFVFPEKMLIVEVDGEFHEQEETQQRDRLKQKQAENLGYTILRFSTKEVSKEIECVIQKIKDWLQVE